MLELKSEPKSVLSEHQNMREQKIRIQCFKQVNKRRASVAYMLNIL